MTGWIKLHRKAKDSVIFQNSNLWQVWSWCLLRANYQEKKVLFGGEVVVLKSGQFISGRFSGSQECYMNPSTFWDKIKRLEELGKVDSKSDNKKTIFTVKNWAKYQQVEESPTATPTTNRQQNDTDKEYKKLLEEGGGMASGLELEQTLLDWWGRDGRQSNAMMKKFVDLGLKYGYEKLFLAIEVAAEQNIHTYAYVLGILEERGNKNGTTRQGNKSSSQAARSTFTHGKKELERLAMLKESLDRDNAERNKRA